MKIDVIDERYPLWVMDSECCCRCGCILGVFESDICTDCLQDERAAQEQDYYDSWFYEWDETLENEAGKP